MERHELDLQTNFLAFCKAAKKPIPPAATGPSNLLMRFLQAHPNDYSTVYSELVEHCVFQMDYCPTQKPDQHNTGSCYIHGRDHFYRPVLVVQVAKLIRLDI